jgi:hypothetical protein
MSCVFQNIDPHPPLRPVSVYLPPLARGEDTLAAPGGEGGGGSIFWKTQDTALYSTYIESSLPMLMQVGTYLLLSWLPERMTGRGASRRLAQAARLGRLAAPSGTV